MEEHKLILCEAINSFFNWIFSLIGISVPESGKIIPDHVIMAVIVTLILVLFFKLSTKKLSIFPSKLQSFLEMIYQTFEYIINDMIGPEGQKFFPALATLGLFILTSNLIGLLPELSSPTANLNVTAGCAIFIFCYYHYQGARKHGFLHYLKTFMGPELWLAPIFFPIEIISHISRVLSLSMRLFGNIFGEDLIILIIASLVAYAAPLPMMAFAIFTSILQAYIFVMLSSLYLAGAIADEH